MTTPKPKRFPAIFWTANTTELFERAAYYSMASFIVIYLGQLGLGTYWPAIFMGVGLASALSMWLFKRWLERQKA